MNPMRAAIAAQQIVESGLEHRQLAAVEASQSPHPGRSRATSNPCGRPRPPRRARGGRAPHKPISVGHAARPVAAAPRSRGRDDPEVIPESVGPPDGAEPLEMLVLQRPGRVILDERHRLLGRPAARKDAGAVGERATAPICRASIWALPFSAKTSQVKWLRHDSSVISSSSFGWVPSRADTTWSGADSRTGCGDEAEVVAEVAEPEQRGVEQMRAEIGQHARALVAPRGIAHQPRGAVAVEHAAR